MPIFRNAKLLPTIYSKRSSHSRSAKPNVAGPKVKGSSPVNFTPEQLEAFNSCKRLLSEGTLLAHPDSSAELAITTDASDVGIGAVLQQRKNGNWQPLAFYSHKLKPSQQKYSPYDRELLAIYEAIRYFRHMIEARDFVVFTDHNMVTLARIFSYSLAHSYLLASCEPGL